MELEAQRELQSPGVRPVGLGTVVIGDSEVGLTNQWNGLAERGGRGGRARDIGRAVVAVVIGVVEDIKPFGEDFHAQLFGEIERT